MKSTLKGYEPKHAQDIPHSCGRLSRASDDSRVRVRASTLAHLPAPKWVDLNG